MLSNLDVLMATKEGIQKVHQHLLDRVGAALITVGTSNKQVMHMHKIVGRVLEDDGYDI